jgi:DNA-directed RNA polymerase specialized sigma subunit
MNDRFRRNDHFRLFAKNLEDAIAKYGDLPNDEIVSRQKAQLEHLVALEGEFRKTLIKHPWGTEVYKAFVTFITEEKRNILAARPYFRERQPVFTERISIELKHGNEKGLFPFNFNYLFVSFVLRTKPWPRTSKIVKLAQQIAELRHELSIMNMPLAISRSQLFFRSTPTSHLEYMDFVQIASEGLLVAIDKFVLPYSHRFRMVAIGRMVGFFIEQYSETLVHFYPTDKRKIYRANKVINRFSLDLDSVDWNKLAETVNKGADTSHTTNNDEIASLVSASSTVSADAPAATSSEGEEGSNLLDHFASLSDQEPDKLAEEAEAVNAMARAITTLSVFEQKYLRLRGMDLAGDPL